MRGKKILSLLLITCMQAVFLAGCTGKDDSLNLLHTNLPYNTPADQMIEKENLKRKYKHSDSSYILPEGETVKFAGYSFDLQYHFFDNKISQVFYSSKKEQQELDFEEYKKSMEKLLDFLRKRYGQETESYRENQFMKCIFNPSEHPNLYCEFTYTVESEYFRRTNIAINYFDEEQNPSQ